MLSSHRRDRSFRDSFSGKVHKSSSKKKGSFKDPTSKRMSTSFNVPQNPTTSPNLNSPIVTITVGPSQRLFAAHQETLNKSPYFAQLCSHQFFETTRRIGLPNEEPEVFSAILEYLYKGDYTPRLEMDKKRGSWYLADGGTTGMSESTVYQASVGAHILKDTAIYCAAEKFGLSELKRLALKKQGLQSGITCSTILASARFAYTFTPDSDSRLRAHYLALIIRSRNTFKRSGTMQEEMERGGKMWFDLFVALVNHLDDVQKGR
ncbi:BTB/POZ domain-containing protein 14 [Elsinoe australis]|uniref:BTB/POZ domain-containing protein 14 n=1 Tax=Elsinoe australis TaxID=40998 RepID=A0A4U7B9Q0_9PEZI|nr:BTB/POZ domain-containing protein 14 [Elsinoe australis]